MQISHPVIDQWHNDSMAFGLSPTQNSPRLDLMAAARSHYIRRVCSVSGDALLERILMTHESEFEKGSFSWNRLEQGQIRPFALAVARSVFDEKEVESILQLAQDKTEVAFKKLGLRHSRRILQYLHLSNLTAEERGRILFIIEGK